MNLYHLLAEPFANYGFMRRSLVACAAIALGGAPLGVFLVLRRMTLIGDAISHAILPGAALAFMFFGLSLPVMAAGGLFAGLLIALVAGSLTQFTQLKEDASFTGTYLLSLAAGVLIITAKGSAIDLMHVLFGNVLAIDDPSLLLVCFIATASMLVLAAIYRPLVVECFDAGFLRASGGGGAWVQQVFLALVVLNLVAAFQALGTLMALGLMVLPAIAVRFWSESIDSAIMLAIVSSLIASFTGLLLSYHLNLPSGPAIILTAGGFYIFSGYFWPQGKPDSAFSSPSPFCKLMPYRFLFIALSMFFALPAQARELSIVTSFSILADMTKEITGTQAKVSSLVGPDADAHVYEPTPQDVKTVADADIVIINGLGFEGWFDRLLQSSGFKGQVVIASNGISPVMTGTTEDPHAWQSVVNAERYVINIRTALIQADPEHAEGYKKLSDQYTLKLNELDTWTRSEIAKVPPEKRIAIIPHNAFVYFAETYGVHFISPLSASTEGDVSAKTMAEIIDQIRTKHIHAVFLENMTDPRLIRQLVKDGGAVIGGTLYSDALSGPSKTAPDYISMFHQNVSLITQAMVRN